MNLLIIDDEKALRNGLVNYLRGMDTPFDEVLSAASGKEALAVFETHSIAAALVDINLGDINGLDLIETIQHRYPQVLITIISGYDDFDFARRAIKLKVFDYLLKPIPKSDLKKLMTNLACQLATTPVPQEAGHDLAAAGKQYIESHYSDKQLNLAQTAQSLFVSDSYLSKQMKETYGESFSEYLIRHRIEKAQELLKDPHLRYSVTDIAHKVGYEDPHYFSRVFRKKVGLSPLQYRQQE